MLIQQYLASTASHEVEEIYTVAILELDLFVVLFLGEIFVHLDGYHLSGTVINIPANVKHWHGAAKDSWLAHLAFEAPGENASNEWLEPVSDEEYNKLK